MDSSASFGGGVEKYIGHRPVVISRARFMVDCVKSLVVLLCCAYVCMYVNELLSFTWPGNIGVAYGGEMKFDLGQNLKVFHTLNDRLIYSYLGPKLQ